MRIFAAIILAVIIGRQSLAAESDVLLQAVSFGITGSDGSKVIVVNRAQCVFKIENATYYLNNVYADRIYVRNWTNKMSDTWSTVELHGKQKVIERFEPPPNFTGSELDRALMAQDPNYFARKGQTTASPDVSLKVFTRESERVTKAWQYIYANGCKGLTSPF